VPKRLERAVRRGSINEVLQFLISKIATRYICTDDIPQDSVQEEPAGEVDHSQGTVGLANLNLGHAVIVDFQLRKLYLHFS
jgi:hypothetical protein